jgi:protein-disulfide isomerase
VITIIVAVCSLAVAQAGGAKPATTIAAPGKAHMTVDVQKQPSTLPSEETVRSFLKQTFGYDPNVQFEVLGISQSEMPGVAHVIVRVGGPQQPPAHLYITPDGEHAILGEVIPFGAHPFAPARRKLETQAKGQRKGATTAPRVTIVEFSDLQCPHCKAGQPVIDKLLAETPGAQLIFQPFPLTGHDWASKAALMGECVAQQNPQAFWKYIQGVFDAQDQITAATAPQKLQEVAQNSGVNGAQVSTCAATQPTARRIQDSIDIGMSLGVSGTPTVFINGRKFTSIASLPYEQLKKVVEFDATQK